MTPPEIRILDHASFARESAACILEEVGRCLEGAQRCHLALAGGSTPRATYDQIFAQGEEVPWDRLELYFTDERCVPPDHEESNFRMVVNHLIPGRQDLLTRLHRMEGEDRNPDHAAARYEGCLPPQLDVVVLGIGEDGHTASLFPGSTALIETERKVVAVVGPLPPVRRITLTPPVIREAGRVLLLATGKRKAPAVAAAIQGHVNFRRVPAQLARGGLWLLDPEAASLLDPQMVQ